jgi:hypothetical protein
MRIPGVATVTGMSILGCVVWGAAPQDDVLITHTTPSGEVTTLVFRPSAEAQTATTARDGKAKTHSKLSVFYPKAGQETLGRCWESVAVDAAGNVYPLGSGQLSKLSSEADFVNGENDTNFFVTSDVFGLFFVLDEVRGTLFMPGRNASILSAPFIEGGVFTPFISGGGLVSANEVALGKGPLAGSLFVTDFATDAVARVNIDPPSVSVFVAPGEVLHHPEAIASAPNGTLYVVDASFDGWRLIEVTPEGVARIFNDGSGTGSGFEARDMIAVNDEGVVFWSFPTGIARFLPDGTRLEDLPGPKDQERFFIPVGGTFDSSGSLYFVDNGLCKSIYKYGEKK